jgi:hypothetical protein
MLFSKAQKSTCTEVKSASIASAFIGFFFASHGILSSARSEVLKEGFE